MSERVNDYRGEKALGIFLDKYFYPTFCKFKGFSRMERVYDVQRQKKGIDVILADANNHLIKIDEKAQLHYINKPTDTFAFEISFVLPDSMKPFDGWFVNELLETDYYMLFWIKKARTDHLNRIVAEDFLNINALYISRNRIKNFLVEHGFSFPKLRDIATEMREGKGKYVRENVGGECYLRYSYGKYEEAPVNLIIGLEQLKNLSDGIYSITKNKVENKYVNCGI